MKYDLAVIGAGPAGMSAAIAAGSRGAKVAIVDENPVAGGKLLGQLHEEPEAGWWIGKDVAKDLANKMDLLGVTCFLQREVWGIFPKWKVKLSKGEELEASNILIATGASEKAIPIPGWTLPGVMAIGAAQVLNNYHRVRPGNKIAVIGIDPLSLTVSRELKMAGADVVGIFLPPKSEFSGGQSNPEKMIAFLSSMSHLAPNPILQSLGKLAKRSFIQRVGARVYPKGGMKVWGIPLYLKRTVLEIKGEENVEKIKTANVSADGDFDIDSIKEIAVDSVCISGGLYPLNELASVANCSLKYNESVGGRVPLYSPEMGTTQQGIFVAGNITGIEGAKVAMAQGELAGLAICKSLGILKNNPVQQLERAKNKVQELRANAVITFKPNIVDGREQLEKLWIESQASSI